jgi:endonuclease/exonuclease/phosphatase (EEP) superfamily protein YafD
MLTLLLRLIIVAGVSLCALVTFLGLLAGWFPLLELFNLFRPSLLIGSIALLSLACLSGPRPLAVMSGAVVATNLALFALAFQGKATAASPENDRFLRVVTFNLSFRNPQIDRAAAFLEQTDADIVVIEEVTSEQRTTLLKFIGSRYPHAIGSTEIVILSKFPARATGNVNEAGLPGWARRPMILWARFESNGVAFEVAGVHFAWPLDSLGQAADTTALISFARGRSAPLVGGGDFNLTPWSVKLQRVTRETELRRGNTFLATWPANRPFAAIDNVFVSPNFSVIKLVAGPDLGSDHRPIVADIALVETSLAASSRGIEE